ncbi:Leucine rich repeat-containing protein [Ruminococcaceae bacterium FB2012]|nr:Leucine rich repeat-containing protein [Ruminococcaceae bacterium FB2012]
MLKRILAAAAAVTMLGFNAFSAGAAVYGDYEYIGSTFYMSADVTKYNGSAESVTVPSYFGDFKVTKLTNTFYKNKTVKNVVIPETVTELASGVFNGCSELLSVTLPSGISKMDDLTFYECTKLESITIPGGVTEIAKNAFGRCRALKTVTIPKSVTSIGYQAFQSCSDLAKLSIGGGVTEIGTKAFTECNSLKKVTVPGNVKTIGSNAFESCKVLATVNIKKGTSEIGAEAFKACPALTDVTLPDSIKSVGDRAFVNCKNLTEIYIPASVTNIGDHAFGFGYYNSTYTKYPLTICCARGSAAEAYAKQYGFACNYYSGIAGDANADGHVNMKDVTTVQRYINGWTVEISIQAADLNGNNTVNMKDLASLQRLVNGWEA